MSGLYDSQAGSRIVQFWIGSAVLAALALTIGVPQWREHQIAKNELEALTVMKYLCSAEADFRANDRDGNKVNDFWTGDVAGLYFLTPTGLPLALIPRAVADADATPRQGSGARAIPYHGYYFMALDSDESEDPPVRYGQDTDRKSGKTRNRERFGFCAFPAEPGVTGRTIYIINENNSIRSNRGEMEPPKSWPSDDDLKRRWGRPGCG
jgi:hypothetical protein